MLLLLFWVCFDEEGGPLSVGVSCVCDIVV